MCKQHAVRSANEPLCKVTQPPKILLLLQKFKGPQSPAIMAQAFGTLSCFFFSLSQLSMPQSAGLHSLLLHQQRPHIVPSLLVVLHVGTVAEGEGV